MILSNEESFLINILFHNKKIHKNEFLAIDFEELVKITSSHLMLPSLYINLKRKKYLGYIPFDLKQYLEEIYKLNKKRNNKLIIEINELSKIFNRENIIHVFLKGASMIQNNYINDIGERMVGDIDLLVKYEEKEKAIKTLNENNYYSKYTYKFWDANVYPNFINKNRLFSVDLHNRLFPKNYNYLMNSNLCIKNSIKTLNGINTLNYVDEFYYGIYNYQIQDFGNLKASYSYRKIYDIESIIKRDKELIELKNNKYINNYFNICEILNTTSSNFHKKKLYGIYIKRFKLKKENKYYFILDNFVCDLLIFIDSLYYKIIETIINKKYRNNVINTIFKKH